MSIATVERAAFDKSNPMYLAKLGCTQAASMRLLATDLLALATDAVRANPGVDPRHSEVLEQAAGVLRDLAAQVAQAAPLAAQPG